MSITTTTVTSTTHVGQLVKRAKATGIKSLVIPGRNTRPGSLIRLCANGTPAPAPGKPAVAQETCPFRGAKVDGKWHRAWIRVP